MTPEKLQLAALRVEVKRQDAENQINYERLCEAKNEIARYREALEKISELEWAANRLGDAKEIARAALQKDCKHAWHPDQETGEYFCLECGQKEEQVKNRAVLAVSDECPHNRIERRGDGKRWCLDCKTELPRGVKE